jgi:hypothetical protein
MRRGKHRISRGKLRWYLLGAAVIALAFAGWRKWQAPEASDLYAAAEVARKQGALKEAIIRYKSFLQAKPEDLAARWRLGQTYLALHQPAAALSELTRASALAATTPELQLPTAEGENFTLVETLKRQARFEIGQLMAGGRVGGVQELPVVGLGTEDRDAHARGRGAGPASPSPSGRGRSGACPSSRTSVHRAPRPWRSAWSRHGGPPGADGRWACAGESLP